MEILVGISYESDLKLAKDTLFRILDSHPLALHLENRMPEVVVSELGDSAVMLTARVWTNTGDYWKMRYGLIEEIKLTFDEAGIEIPYNKLDVNLHS